MEWLRWVGPDVRVPEYLWRCRRRKYESFWAEKANGSRNISIKVLDCALICRQSRIGHPMLSKKNFANEVTIQIVEAGAA